jgi:transcriptional regulator with XRE-family HTH domain
MEYNYTDIGKRLKEKRISLGKEVKDIIEEVKISEEYLVAIEEGKIEDLPSLIYYNLFVRSYAQELGLDSEQLFEDASTEEPFTEDREIERKIQENVEKKQQTANYTSPAKIIMWIGGFIIVAFAAVLIFTSLCKQNESEKDAIEDTTSIVEKTDQDDNLVMLDSMADSLMIQSGVITDSLIQEEIVIPMKLDIVASQLCWILILADGDTVLHRNLDSNAVRTLTALDSFNIFIGNPDAVELHLNDTLLGSLTRPGRVVVSNAVITQENKSNYYFVEPIDADETLEE